MKKLLVAVILIATGTNFAYALSENASTVVVQYPAGFSIGDLQTTNCTTPSYADCLVLNKQSGNSVLYKNTNGTLTTLYSPATLDILAVKSDATLPTGFGKTQVGENGYWLLKTDSALTTIDIVKGKVKMNAQFICVYDRNTQVLDSYPYPRRLIAGYFSNSDSYVCPGTYNGFNLVDFYGANPYVAPNTNPCGLNQEEIDAGVTCGGNSGGTGSTNSTELPVDENSFMFYQEIKIVLTGIILAVLLIFHFFKYARD